MQSAKGYILSYLLNSLWQVPLLFAAGWLVARMQRAPDATVEHRVWVITLWLQSLVPAWSLLPWEWLRAFSFWSGTLGLPHDPKVSIVLAGGTSIGGSPWSTRLWTLLALLYLLACAYFVARFLCRGRALRALRQDALPVVLTGEATEVWEQCCRRFGVTNASLAASSRIAGPVTLGFRRKLVLLPKGMADALPAADLHTVIAHECAHMGRSDFTWNLLYELISLPVAYHPLLQLARERTMQTREMVCDRLAADVTGRHVYARSLLRLASMLVNGMPVRTPHTIGIFDAHLFERRIMNLTGKDRHIGRARRLAALAACAALTLGACDLAFAWGMRADQPSSSESGHASKQISLSIPSNVMSKNLLSKAVPQYPAAAKKAKIEGTVVLDAVIGKDGYIENLRVVSGPKELQQSALDAVRQWIYKPYLLNGDPVEVKTTVNIIYSLAG